MMLQTQTVIEKATAPTGTEQTPDITGKDLKFPAQSRPAKGAPGPGEAFKEHGVDYVVADDLDELVEGMNELARGPKLDTDALRHQIEARDRERSEERRVGKECRSRWSPDQ